MSLSVNTRDGNTTPVMGPLDSVQSRLVQSGQRTTSHVGMTKDTLDSPSVLDHCRDLRTTYRADERMDLS